MYQVVTETPRVSQSPMLAYCNLFDETGMEFVDLKDAAF